MLPDDIRTAIRQLILLRQATLQSGGVSPLGKVYDAYCYQQKYVLGIFGLKNTPECRRIMNQPVFPFAYNCDKSPLDWGAEIEFDSTLESSMRDNGTRYREDSHFVRIKTLEEQIDKVISALKEKSRKLYGE